MPDIDSAFVADAADAVPGQKFHVLGGGSSGIGGRRVPLLDLHPALTGGLHVTAPDTDREPESRFGLLDPDRGEVDAAIGSLSVRARRNGRSALLTISTDQWNLTFPAPRHHSPQILANGSERSRG